MHCVHRQVLPGRRPRRRTEARRHDFGVKGDSCQTLLNTLPQLNGHFQFSTTSIYADALGEKAVMV